SSGIGKAIAEYFSKKGWNVAATMRNPKSSDLGTLPNSKIYKLDVTDELSIKDAIQSAIDDFGNIDVIVNNAGYGAVGVLEKATDKQLRRQFDVNVFGVFNVIREILPYFRSKSKGTIINITSVGGRLTFPLYSAYHGTKWAVEGFAESLQYELKPFGIKIKNVEPGAIKTDFYDRSQDLFKNDELKNYDEYERVCMGNMQKTGEKAPGPLVVAKVVWKAANSNSNKLRYIAGNDAKMLLFIRKIIPLNWFMGLVRSVVEKGYKK
ncbi:MAG TPA: SDR family oxidoreductase, partial [Bacteroidetes bacterium]|nr:SDR family oxidoreductase [Bacteroidota bacterium]